MKRSKRNEKASSRKASALRGPLGRRWSLWLAPALAAWALFIISPPKAALAQDDAFCLGCHGQEGITKTLVDGRTVSLMVNEAVFKASVHRDVGCMGCHTEAASVPHPAPMARVACGSCHTEEQSEYLKSIHGQDMVKGEAEAPRCSTCHGTHEILKVNDPASAAHPLNLMRVCINCHEDPAMKSKYDLPSPDFIKAYENSVHGQALRKGGLVITALCNDCHGTHTILPADDPDSAVNRQNIPADCGKCHSGITEVYLESIHGEALKAGNLDAPVCTDCHGEHTILKRSDPKSKVAPTNVPVTCSACHDDVELAETYGLPKRRLVTYLDSYHGVANKFGVRVVADCSSCHGVHDIRPSSDPKSSINKQNLPETCGKCHPGAGKHFAEGPVHVEATKESLYGKWLVRRFYTIFISILVLLFVSYVALDLLGHRRHKSSGREDRGNGH